MKQISTTVQGLWEIGGPFIGDDGAAHARVTVEKTFQLTTTAKRIGNYDKGPVRWFQRADNSQVETEVPNILNIDIDRSIDNDAATCKIVVANQQMRPNNQMSAGDLELGQPGYFTFNRGTSAEANTRWSQQANEWHDVLVPNALLRTYQGYGGRSKTIAQALVDGNIYLTGLWLVDEVQIGTDGRITLSCRDMAKLLIEQQLYPPLVPRDQYPLDYCRYYWKNQTVQKLVATAGQRRLVYEYSGNELWYGGGGAVHGHNPRDATDGNGNTFWLSVGNVSPQEPYATEWVQYDCGEQIDQVTIWPFAGNYKCYVSIMENGQWQGAEQVPYAPAGVGRYNGVWNAKIPAVTSFGVPWERSVSVPLPRVYNAQKVRFSFTQLARTQWGPYPYRAGVREVSVAVATNVLQDQTITVQTDGNYKDYSEIVKDLLLWSGFYLFNSVDVVGAAVNAGKPIPRVYGNIETTGVWAEATTCIPAETFDKLPVIDAVNNIKQIVGYLFWVDDQGGARFESPNWWVPGNFFENGTHTNRMVEIDEKRQITQYAVAYKDTDARSEIIVATAEPTQDLTGTIISRYTPPTAPVLKGIVRTAMFPIPLNVSQREADIMARLLGTHSLFALRQGSLTCPANPAVQINDQVRIYERQSGESYIHYVRGLSTSYDALAGTWTMTLTTHWLGDRNNWAFRVDSLPSGDPVRAAFDKMSRLAALAAASMQVPSTTLTIQQQAYTRYSDEVMFDTPAAYWRFDDASGTSAVEKISANNGTYVGTVTLNQPSIIDQNGRFNDPTRAVTTDGSSSYITLPVSIGTTASIEAVVNWTSGPTVMRDSSSGGAGWIFLYDNGGNLAYRVAGTTYTTSTVTSAARGGAHHVVLTKSGSTVKLYLDGTLIHTGTGASNTASTSPWFVGKDGLDPNYSQVTVDEIVFYTTVLSPARVTVHNQGFAGQKK